MNPLMLLALVGGGLLLLNSNKQQQKTITPLKRPPTDAEKAKGYYFVNCNTKSKDLCDVVILDAKKAYEYAFQKGFTTKLDGDNIVKTLKEDLFDNVFDFEKKKEDKKSTQAEFDKFLDKINFLMKLISYFFLGVLENEKLPPTKEAYIAMEKLISEVDTKYRQKYNYLDTSKMVSPNLPKGFDFDKNCNLSIIDKEEANRFFYNMGLYKAPYLDNSADYNLFLFEDCFSLFSDENADTELNFKQLSKLNKDQAKFIYDGIRYMMIGYLTNLTIKGQTTKEDIEKVKIEFLEMLNNYRKFFNDLGIDSNKWNSELPSKPSNA